jgi:hypothetical protein
MSSTEKQLYFTAGPAYRTVGELCKFDSSVDGACRWNCGYHDRNKCKKGGGGVEQRENYVFLQGTVRCGRPLTKYMSGV